ncbi:hypothetical protein ACS0TY_027375 [Phlomoides rotata]
MEAARPWREGVWVRWCLGMEAAACDGGVEVEKVCERQQKPPFETPTDCALDLPLRRRLILQLCIVLNGDQL